MPVDNLPSNSELDDLLNFMESTTFNTRFLDRVLKIALQLRVDAIQKSGAQPTLENDKATVYERIVWLKGHVREIKRKREQDVEFREVETRFNGSR